MKTRICLLTLLLALSGSVSAAKTVLFNGKNYKVYPQYVKVYPRQIGNVSINGSYLQLENLEMPPIIGQHEDGDYILYIADFNLKYKGKYKGVPIFDTLRYVYATFTIKNNQKNGSVYLYKKNSKVPYFQVPYVDDLLHGSVFMSRDVSKSERAHFNIGMVRKKNYEINFFKGMQHGNQYIRYILKNKDTILYRKDEMSYGYKNGWSIKLNLENKTNIRNEIPDSTYYINGKIDSIAYSHSKGYRIIVTYKGGDFFSQEFYMKGKLKAMFYYSRDSIYRFVKDADKENKLPFEYSSNDARDFVYVGLFENQSPYITYCLDNHVRYNYYKGYSAYRDTNIGGVFYIYKIKPRVWANDVNTISYEYMKFDTCVKEVILNKVKSYEKYLCKNLAFTVNKNLKTNLNSVEYTSAFFMNYSDSSSILLETEKLRHLEIKKYYYPILKYSYWNLEFKSGKSAGCKEFYIVKGNKVSGHILHVMTVPLKGGDTLTCIDTLMRNGKYLYSIDREFNQEITEYLSLYDYKENTNYGKSSEFNYFSIQFYNFLLPLPVRHSAILIGNKAFSGWFNVNFEYNRKDNEVSGGVYVAKSILSKLTNQEFIELDLELGRNYRRVNKYRRIILPPSRLYAILRDGMFDGVYGISNVMGRKSTEMYFANNRINSTVRINALKDIERYEFNDFSENIENKNENFGSYAFIKYNKLRYVASDNPILNYKNGHRDGQWYINDYNSKKCKTYRDGVVNGLVSNFEVSKLYLNPVTFLYELYEVKNDTVNGVYWSFFSSGRPSRSGNFKMGVPNGYFYQYKDEDTANGNFLERVYVENGYVKGQYIRNRDSGGIQLSVTVSDHDSSYIDLSRLEDYYYSDEYHYSSDFNDDKTKSLLTIRNDENYGINQRLKSPGSIFSYLQTPGKFKRGYFKYHYNGGALFAEGNKKLGEPYGTWKFYRLDGKTIYKIVDFMDTVVYTSKNESIQANAKVTAYYEDGKTMFKGWATDRSSKYSCESGAEMPTEEDVYIEFYDTLGKLQPINDSCYVIEYQVNGYKLKEGLMLNGKKSGIWIYYSRYGLPTEIGLFVNGKKEGRWLSGDLSGLNLSEEVCLMSSEEFMAWIALFGGNLNLEESFYENGRYVRSNSVETVKE